MTITNNVVAKASVAFVALAMAISLVAPKAQAAEVSDMSLDELIALVNQLQSQVGQNTDAIAAAGSCVSIPAPLTIGSQGANVTALQNALIAAGQSIPAGATGYFGAQTQSALAAWQAANGVAPAVGYYGPITQAAWDAKCVPADGDDDDDTDGDDDTDSDDDDTDLSGEASLDDVTINDGDETDLEEGQEDAPVAELDVEFSDGDAMITRIDLTLVGGTEETDPWDVFETVSLWVDGDMVAEMAADDEDEYLDEDDGSLRFSGLDIVAMEDEEVTITIGVTVQENVEGADVGETWEVAAAAIRYVDADDVTTTDDSTGDLDGAGLPTPISDTVSFDIEEEGGDDELIIKTSTEDPESTTLILEDDTNSDWMTIFAYDLDTDDSTNDIEVNTIAIGLQTVGANVTEVVNDIQLVIDGETYDDFEYGDSTGTEADGEFDIDGDLVIEAGERVTVEVQVEFKKLPLAGLTAGDTITASTTDEGYDAEGADDLGDAQITGAATGDAHTLRTEGISTEGGDTETSTQGTNDTAGIFEIEFDVTAFEGDFYINDLATSSLAANNGATFSVDGPGSPTATGVLSSTADDDTGAFVVREGETETFTLTVTVDAGTTGQHRVVLDEVWFSATNTGLSGSVHLPLPEADYRTDYENINAS